MPPKSKSCDLLPPKTLPKASLGVGCVATQSSRERRQSFRDTRRARPAFVCADKGRGNGAGERPFPPCGGRTGRGVTPDLRSPHGATPHPNPPPQGGRGRAFARHDRAEPVMTERATRSSLAGSSAGSCGTRRPSKAALRIDCLSRAASAASASSSFSASSAAARASETRRRTSVDSYVGGTAIGRVRIFVKVRLRFEPDAECSILCIGGRLHTNSTNSAIIPGMSRTSEL